MKKRLFCIVLLMILCGSVLSGAAEDGKISRIHELMEELRPIGVEADESVLAAIANDPYIDLDCLNSYELLYCIAEGDYDYDTGEWTPWSHQLYAFDLEVFDISNMYSLFLHGVQAIVPDITITDIWEDLSGMDEELEGRRSVSFRCNGHLYRFKMTSYGDWFNDDMFDFMDRVLEAEGCPNCLYSNVIWQDVIMLYGTADQAENLFGWIEEHGIY